MFNQFFRQTFLHKIIYYFLFIFTTEALLFGKDKEININDSLGQKMCLVLCLQRGHLDEALKLANQLHEKNKKNTVLNELMRYLLTYAMHA